MPVSYADYPPAAYLYTVSLDPPGLAWEYLRRSPGYCADWARGADSAIAAYWGLRRPGRP